MYLKRAVLIQELKEYFAVTRGILNQSMERFAETGIDEETVTRWMIEHQIERMYNIAVKGHKYHLGPHNWIYGDFIDRMRDQKKIDFDPFFAAFVRVPILYDDHFEIDVSVNLYRSVSIGFWHDGKKNPRSYIY